MDSNHQLSYWGTVWNQFRKKPLGMIGLGVIFLFSIVGIYAPFLASSKPLFVSWNGEWYFPLFKYLFYQGFFTKKIDLFFNLMMFTAPLTLFLICIFKYYDKSIFTPLISMFFLQLFLFAALIIYPFKDPASSPKLNEERAKYIQECAVKGCQPTWEFELKHMTRYAQLNMLLRYQLRKKHHLGLIQYVKSNANGAVSIPTLWQQDRDHEKNELERLKLNLLRLHEENKEGTVPYLVTKQKLDDLISKKQWFEDQSKNLHYLVLPLVRWFHWEDDAGGEQSLNQYIPWWDLTRINRKDLVAALIFGIRISLVVGILAVSIALMIGVPFGALAGYFGGNIDIALSRLLEVWESMPTFFMLLMIVAVTQTKSIFLVISIVGLFGWTGFSRFVRGEFFKQRNLPYVEACRSLGFNNRHIMFSHILPNAIPPLLTLLPFAIMSAITSEAGLSFLGLGEEGSCSWGVLMDEGRSAFPGESYLLWPPAILLTILLISIALVGDAMRDAFDPKMHE